MSEQLIHGTYEDYKRLLDSVVWQDIVREVDAWLQEMRDRLEVIDDMAELKRCQGISEACRHFIGLPYNLMKALEGNYDVRTEL